MRNKALELAKLLNSAAQPVYVLDDELVILFCNDACQDWVGRRADELLGRRCRYHSTEEVGETDAAAAGLCPPPGAMAGQDVAGVVVRIDPVDGRLARRRARFVPLGRRTEGIVGLVVLVDGEDLPEADLLAAGKLPEQSETAWLHEQVRAFRRRTAGRYRADLLIGESPAIRRARTQIVLAASSRASVLIFGPPGSGRQHTARAIHYADAPKSAGSLVPLACGLLGEELIGSTVAALAKRELGGQQSAQTTLLLNDVDRLPRGAQIQLARLLGERAFPLRLIATAAESLLKMARQDRFREDLASILATIEIALPPLAERREDLPMLLQLFVEEANAKTKSPKQVAGFSREALDRLDAYAWPGNLDELIRLTAAAHAKAEGVEIVSGDLPERIRLAAEATARPRREEETIVLDEFLGRVERELLRRALRQAKGNKTKAAKLLGMTRPRLYRRLVQLGLIEQSDSPDG
jgi:DNA-binding NtrC family response regulator